MGEKEDKEKAEKLAAAKKRVAQLQAKKKKAATSGSAEKSSDAAGSKGKSKKKQDKEKEKDAEDDVAAGEDQIENGNEEPPVDEEPAQVEAEAPETTSREPLDEEEEVDEDTAAFNDAITAANTAASMSPGPESPTEESTSTSKARQHPGRQPSISLQSKLRSTSFRQGPLSPSGQLDENAESMYRKQSLRIEELEKENSRLAKEASENEARWRKSEEQLEDVRGKTAEQTSKNDEGEEIHQLRAEIETLKRGQRQSLSAAAGKGRQSSVSTDDSELKKELESKDSTISDLQLEISRLRSQLSSQTEGCETHGEQIAALQKSLSRAESSVKKLETELSDTKRALSRASEKAVVDGTERTSKETKIRSLEKESEELTVERDDLKSKMEALAKKVDAMNKLHREAEERANKKLTAAEAQARESQTLRARIETQEKEISRLREAKKRTLSGSGGDDGLEELEDEERTRMERRIRELETQVFDLQRGVWRDRRKEMQPGMTDGDDFDDVDLSGSMPVSRRPSSISRQSLGAGQTRHSGFTQVINSGLAAFRGPTASPDTQKTRPRNDSLLQEFDDDDAFDMSAFAAAQKEEEMKKMVEHVREVKRGLKKWVGWRLDLVDSRSGGGSIGVGEVFEV